MSEPFKPHVYKRAIVKFNGGRGALLCNRCRIIIREGTEHEDVEHYCGDCRMKQRRFLSRSEEKIRGHIVASPEAFPDSVIERIRKLEDEGE